LTCTPGRGVASCERKNLQIPQGQRRQFEITVKAKRVDRIKGPHQLTLLLMHDPDTLEIDCAPPERAR